MWRALGGHNDKSLATVVFWTIYPILSLYPYSTPGWFGFFRCSAAGGVVSGLSGGVGWGAGSKLTCTWRFASNFLNQVWPFIPCCPTVCIMLSGLITDFWLSFNVYGIAQKLWQSLQLWKQISLWRMEEYCQMLFLAMVMDFESRCMYMSYITT